MLLCEASGVFLGNYGVIADMALYLIEKFAHSGVIFNTYANINMLLPGIYSFINMLFIEICCLSESPLTVDALPKIYCGLLNIEGDYTT